MSSSESLPLYEVFIRSRRGLEHKHTGSVHADSDEMALQYAREVYTRRSEGISLWVVRSDAITSSQEDDAEMFYDPSDDKPYRHAQHYQLPDEVNNM
jgi:ring-1,2-phenylacetyl-CoA epoxidase subunit PaaB